MCVCCVRRGRPSRVAGSQFAPRAGAPPVQPRRRLRRHAVMRAGALDKISTNPPRRWPRRLCTSSAKIAGSRSVALDRRVDASRRSCMARPSTGCVDRVSTDCGHAREWGVDSVIDTDSWEARASAPQVDGGPSHPARRRPSRPRRAEASVAEVRREPGRREAGWTRPGPRLGPRPHGAAGALRCRELGPGRRAVRRPGRRRR